MISFFFHSFIPKQCSPPSACQASRRFWGYINAQSGQKSLPSRSLTSTYLGRFKGFSDFCQEDYSSHEPLCLFNRTTIPRRLGALGGPLSPLIPTSFRVERSRPEPRLSLPPLFYRKRGVGESSTANSCFKASVCSDSESM